MESLQHAPPWDPPHCAVCALMYAGDSLEYTGGGCVHAG